MIGDDTGENISLEKRYFNEMTALYWAWKNYDKLGDPDFVGLSHYRRHFVFNEKAKLPERRWLPECPVYWYEGCEQEYKNFIDTKYLNDMLEKYDIITTYEYDTKKQNLNKVYNTLKDRFCELTGFDGELYEIMKNYIANNYPDYKKDIDIFEGRTDHHLFNMFVMRKDLFFDYCNFIFPTLFEIKKHLIKRELNFTEMRAPGFLAEFITSIFIRHNERVARARVKNLNVMFLNRVITSTELGEMKKQYLINILKFNLIKIYSIFNKNIRKSLVYQKLREDIHITERNMYEIGRSGFISCIRNDDERVVYFGSLKIYEEKKRKTYKKIKILGVISYKKNRILK